MAVDFFFENPTYDIPPLWKLRFEWKNIPQQSREIIVGEYQYLLFHLYMIRNIRHTGAGKVKTPTHIGELSLGIRAGIVKAALLIAGSIVEEALLAHAIQRKYKLPPDEKKRTFGVIIKVWEDSGSSDIKLCLTEIKSLRDARNNVHLHQLVKSEDQFYEKLQREESKHFKDIEVLIKFLMNLKS